VAPEGLAEWLLLRGLALSPEMDAVVQAHVAAGDSFLGIHPLAPVAGGTFLPPVRFDVPTATPHVLPPRRCCIDAEFSAWWGIVPEGRNVGHARDPMSLRVGECGYEVQETGR